jgi:hypothetical protein
MAAVVREFSEFARTVTIVFRRAVTEVTGSRREETNIHPAAPLLKVEADDVRRGGVYSFITIHSGGRQKIRPP